MREASPVVYIFYGYASLQDDAITKVASQLRDGLRTDGIDARLVGLRSLPRRLGGPLEKARSTVKEFLFLLQALGLILLRWPSLRAVVALEYPPGMPMVGRLAHLVSRGRIMDVTWVMDLYALMPGGPSITTGLRSFKSSLSRWALGASSRRVVLGSCMSRLLKEASGLDSRVIPLWHRELDVPVTSGQPDRLNLLYSGNARDIHPLRALGQVVDGPVSRGRVHFRVTGSGKAIVELEELARTMTASAIHVSSFVPEASLIDLYGASDVQVVSLAEGATGTCVPSKTYAAMSAGRPILYLGSPEGQAALDVIEAGCGIVVPTGSRRRIEEVLEGFLEDPALVRRMGDAGRHFARERRSTTSLMPLWRDALGLTR